MSAMTAHTIATEIFAALGKGTQVAPFSSRVDGFDLQIAYRVAMEVRAMRTARGEYAVGRKIGFTNRTIWAEYAVWAPIWGYVYDRTVTDIPTGVAQFALDGLAEPRIEPEIVFGLASTPASGMDDAKLLGCLDWVAHGFEIVQSIYPGWKFAAADTVAAFGLHGALLIGARHRIAPDSDRWRATLNSFEIDLLCDGLVEDRGRAANVLDGPLSALRHLVELLERDPAQPPLAAGETVTTGTLTRALPISPGQTWSTRLRGVALGGLRVRFS
ncbi:MAG: hydratase [Betaproteobacteria bacterium]